MAPRKRQAKTPATSMEDAAPKAPPSKRITKTDCEKRIVKAKLDALEQEESLIKEDRFSIEEKKRLLDAYNDHGFNVFHKPELLVDYLPNRRAQDIKGLIRRFEGSLQKQNLEQSKSDQPDCSKLDDWEKLCNQLTRNYAKDKKLNMDDVYAQSLKLIAEELNQTSNQNDDKPNYSELLRNFSQILSGEFPEKTNPINGQISRQIFEHINSLVDSIDLEPIAQLFEDGRWLQSDSEERDRLHDMALEGLNELRKGSEITHKKMREDKNLEVLCLELPKIKRLTEILNPLRMNRSFNKVGQQT